jgi:hypothetical protein
MYKSEFMLKISPLTRKGIIHIIARNRNANMASNPIHLLRQHHAALSTKPQTQRNPDCPLTPIFCTEKVMFHKPDVTPLLPVPYVLF